MAGKNLSQNWLAMASHDARVFLHGLRVQFRAAATLRGAFILQVIGMVINNSAIVVTWLFMFHRFGTIHGWSGADFIGLQGVNMVVFGVMMIACTGILELPRHVDQGSFDTFLTRPSGLLWQLSASAIDVSTIGDLLLGGALLVWYLVFIHISVLSSLLFVAGMVEGCVLFWCFAVLLPSTLAFYVFDSERLSRYAGSFFMDAGIYPTAVLTGRLRIALLTVLPALFLGAVQIGVVRGLNLWLIVLGAVVAAFWLIVSLWIFHRSVRRYESANLVGMH